MVLLSIPRPIKELILTEKELAELQKDKQRLDWLSDTSQNVGNVLLPKEIVLKNVHSLRHAIDDTMNMASIEA